jgi:gas vesicle protein
MTTTKMVTKKFEAIKAALNPNLIAQARRRERRRGLAKGLAAGTFIGGLVGVFFAPDKGENTRQKTKEEVLKAKDKLEVNMEEGKEKIATFYGETREVLEEKASDLKKKLQN